MVLQSREDELLDQRAIAQRRKDFELVAAQCPEPCDKTGGPGGRGHGAERSGHGSATPARPHWLPPSTSIKGSVATRVGANIAVSRLGS